MSGNPWGKKDLAPSTKLDWSEQVEEEEAQNGGVLAHKGKGNESPMAGDAAGFPTLGEAAKLKAPKKKMTLAEFHSGGQESESNGKFRAGPYGRRELTEQEIKMSLPTGPRERDINEPRERRGWGDGGGGGFRQGGYGSSRYDDQPRREDEGASRADESDNWGREKKFAPSDGGGGGGYGGRSSGFGSSYNDFHGKADEVDNWKMGNKFTPSSRSGGGGGGFGGSFRDSRDQFDRGSRGYGFRAKMEYDDPPGNRADTEDRWGSRRQAQPSGYDPPRDRPRLVLNARTKPLRDNPTPLETRSSTRSSVFGDAKPREEVLKERRASEAMSMSAGSDAGSVPGSNFDYRTGSNPGTPGSAMDSMRSGQEAFHPKPRSDPFGGARPREENLSRSQRESDQQQQYCVEEISH